MGRVLLFCHDRLHASMAGPAIRYWEFAHALAREHEVTLFSGADASLSSDLFAICSPATTSLKKAVQAHDVIVSQLISIKLAYFAKKYQKKIILDCYDPLPIENLEFYKHLSPARQMQVHQALLKSVHLSFSMADRMICASSFQRDFWLGHLSAHHLITPAAYDQDPAFLKKIGIVPFGLDEKPPNKNGKGLREIFQLNESDFVLLWGGGIWNWFDPLTLIHAIKILRGTHPHIKLVFMGTKHPNPDIPEMKMTTDAVTLAKELDLVDQQVFFNFGWIPYDERQNFLLDANVGASCHFPNLETRFSFRTRILDYLWAGLPILTTEGDFFADLVQKEGLGRVVAAQHPKALADIILDMAHSPEQLKHYKTNIAKIKHQFAWNQVTMVLKEYIQDLTQGDATIFSWREFSNFVTKCIK